MFSENHNTVWDGPDLELEGGSIEQTMNKIDESFEPSLNLQLQDWTKDEQKMKKDQAKGEDLRNEGGGIMKEAFGENPHQ